MAASLDGKIGLHPRESDADRRRYGFTDEEDREFVRQQITQADAIITGANSMRASGKAWQQIGRGGKYPLWVVMTRHGLEDQLEFWRQEQIPRWVVSPESVSIPAAAASSGAVKNLTYGTAHPARFVYDQLRQAGCERVLLFGGGQINQLFYAEGLVDELRLTLCPLLVGSEDAPNLLNSGLAGPKALRLLSSQPKGSHVFLHYMINKS